MRDAVASFPKLRRPLSTQRTDVADMMERQGAMVSLFELDEFRCVYLAEALARYLDVEGGFMTPEGQTHYFNAFDITNHFTFVEILNRFQEGISTEMQSAVMHTNNEGEAEMLSVYSFVLQETHKGTPTHYVSLFYTQEQAKLLNASCRYDLDKLTPKQRECFDFLLGHDTREEIAAALNISARTLDNLAASVYQTLGLQNRAELIRTSLEL